MYLLASVVCGLLYASLLEWLIHRFILHKLGRDKSSFFTTHWRGHHKFVRTNKGHDPDYLRPLRQSNRAGEVVGLSLVALFHLPLVLIAPVFYVILVSWALLYYWVHKKSHVNPAWGFKWVPWHMQHHLGKNQDMNYGVVIPLWDHVFKTRIKYKLD